MDPGQVVQPNSGDDQNPQQPADTTPVEAGSDSVSIEPQADSASNGASQPPPPPPAEPPAQPAPAPPPVPPEPPASPTPPPPPTAPAESTAPVSDADLGTTPQQEQAQSNPLRSDQPQPTQNPDEPPAGPPSPTPPPAEPPATPPDSPPSQPPPADQAAADSSPLFSWEASEYIEHERSNTWYIILAAISLGLIAFLIIVLREWLSALVVASMAGAIYVYARKSPRVLQYQLNPDGIAIGGKLYPYEDFRSFALVPHGAFDTVEFDPLRRFMPRINVFFDKGDEEQILSILEEILPRNERQADAIDRLSHYLKF